MKKRKPKKINRVKEYNINIKRTTLGSIVVETQNKEQAIIIAKEKYNKGMIVWDREKTELTIG